MMRRTATMIVAAALVAACGGESHQDLRSWMADQGKGTRGRLDPVTAAPITRRFEMILIARAG